MDPDFREIESTYKHRYFIPLVDDRSVLVYSRVTFIDLSR